MRITVRPSVVSKRIRGSSSRVGLHALSLLLLSTSSAALAQSQSGDPEAEAQAQTAGTAAEVDPATIVVTGAATPVEQKKIGNTLTVIEGETIETKQTAYLQDILREAKANAGSLYHAFPTKQDVLLAVLNLYREGIGPMLLAPAWALPPHGSPGIESSSQNSSNCVQLSKSSLRTSVRNPFHNSASDAVARHRRERLALLMLQLETKFLRVERDRPRDVPRLVAHTVHAERGAIRIGCVDHHHGSG